MPLPIERVEPGDLITARFMNDVLGALDQFDQRLTAIEGSGAGPQITSREPSGDLTVPVRLVLRGRNFVSPPNGNNVLVDGSALPLVFGSTPEMLIVDVPAGGALPRDATVTVANRLGSTSIVIRLQQAAFIPHGRLTVVDATPPVATIQANRSYPLRWEVRLDGATERFSVELQLSDPVPAAELGAWQRGVTLAGPSEITVQDGVPSIVTANAVIPPAPAQSVDAVLVVRSHNNPGELTTTSSLLHLAVGQSLAQNDGRIRFEALDVETGDNVRIDPPNTWRRTIAAGMLGRIRALVTMSEPGTYRYSAEVRPTTAGYTVAAVSPQQLDETGAGPYNQRVRVEVQAPSGAVSATLVLHVEKPGAGGYRSFHQIPISTH